MNAIRAWRVTIKAHNFTIITMARSRSQAIYRNFLDATDSGYKFKWVEFRAVRSKEHDPLFARLGLFSYSLDTLNKINRGA